MKDFLYYEPNTIDEAVDLLNSLTGKIMPLAGGTDLIRRMRKNMINPDALINLNRIEKLKKIEYDPDEGLRIGAGVTISTIESSELISKHFGCLIDIAENFGTPQVRNFGTIAGNICNGSPASDYAPVLLALNASVKLQGKLGIREVLLSELYENHSSNVFEQGELLIETSIPIFPKKAKVGCTRHTTRDYLDVSIISLCVYAELNQNRYEHVRIGLGSLAPTPIRAYQTENFLINKSILPGVIEESVAHLLREIQPIDDFRASAEYRKEMVKTNFIRTMKKLSDC